MKSLRNISPSGRAGIFLGILFALFYAAACWFQYRAFGYGDFDLAVHVQSLWQLLRGSLDCSILGIPWPGNHANWVIVLLAPIFWLAPSPLTLLFLQALALALAAWPIYLLAQHEFGEERYGLLFVFAYCFYAPVGHVALFEFHPIAFATPLLLAAFYCARIRCNRWFVIWSILAATCQEDVPLVVAALCAYRLITERLTHTANSKAVSWMLGGAMLIWFILCVAVIGPYFNQGNVGWINLYEQFGKSGGEIVRNFFLRPDTAFSTLWEPGRADFLLRLFGPLIFLSLLAPEVVLIAAPSFAQHLLSLRQTEQSVEYHYTATLTPFLLAAAILGTARLFRWLEANDVGKLATELRQTILISLAITLVATNFVYGGFYRLSSRPEQFRRSALSLEKERLLSQIPARAAVVCSFDTMARLAMRPECYSMHYIVSGQKTLSTQRVKPPPPVNYAIVDFSDRLLFETIYHPALDQADGTVLPSSEKLLRQFFRKYQWTCQSWTNSWAVFQRHKSGESAGRFSVPSSSVKSVQSATLPDGLKLMVKQLQSALEGKQTGAVFELEWKTDKDRATRMPPPYWVLLELSNPRQLKPVSIRHGPCQLFKNADRKWQVVFGNISPGEYDLNIVVYDREELARSREEATNFEPTAKIPLGKMTLNRM